MSIATAGAGAAALVVYSLAAERPRDLRTAHPDYLGPSDDQVRHLDPNAGLIDGPLHPMQPNELRPLDADSGTGDSEGGELPAPAESWLTSAAYGDGQAAERLAKALLAKGAPNDLIAIVRRTSVRGSVDWRVEIGPLTADQAADLQALLQELGLSFSLE
ncbi:hypothetical protein [Achromobacter animicus]|uniref:hypothetical protein n=1 Tax=Achromobacter animicus TaxID=1389935 RepID=UPI00244732B5|nr:hypothetical protein [Achromobacter animicus]MDH0682943.1 SPOR domain-containing protein [Achromobacter animicus]